MEGENKFDGINKESHQINYGSVDCFSAGSDFALTPGPERRSLREKMLVISVALVSFTAVYLGYYKLSSTIASPFVGPPTNQNGVAATDAASAELASVLELQNKDTDGDGLSDYDELNSYQTSPFLEDSDSDGIDDGAEVAGGNDPNCPGSESCFHSDGAPNGAAPASGISQLLLSGQASPAMLRQVLLDNGFSADLLDKISDDDLLAVYDSALSGNTNAIVEQTANSSIGGSVSTSTDPEVDVTSVADLQNLTGAQIRLLMIQDGADESLLSQINDDQLKEMFLKQLAEKTKSQ